MKGCDRLFARLVLSQTKLSAMHLTLSNRKRLKLRLPTSWLFRMREWSGRFVFWYHFVSGINSSNPCPSNAQTSRARRSHYHGLRLSLRSLCQRYDTDHYLVMSVTGKKSTTRFESQPSSDWPSQGRSRFQWLWQILVISLWKQAMENTLHMVSDTVSDWTSTKNPTLADFQKPAIKSGMVLTDEPGFILKVNTGFVSKMISWSGWRQVANCWL